MVDSAAMEIAAEIMETSANIEQTVDGTEAFNLKLGIVLALKRMFVSVAFKLENDAVNNVAALKKRVVGEPR